MTNSRAIHERTPTRLDKTVGCMLGGAVGDALGVPVEFLDLPEIHRRCGHIGVTRFEEGCGRKGTFTDDTQMTLFTAEGLIISTVRDEYHRGDLVIHAIYHAYIRWLYTQGAISVAVRLIRKHKRHDDCLNAVDHAVALAHSHKPSTEAIETLGTGRVAEEALGIDHYCAMVAGDDFRQGALSAVNHLGGSDSIGSIAGAGYGAEVIPTEWLIPLEMKDLIQESATDLFDRFNRQPAPPN